MTEPAVSFVIPVRNDAARLRQCLASIRANRYPPEKVEVLVADNGSSDDSCQVAQDAGARVLSLPGLRVGALRNAAANEALGELLAFVDADNEIGPRWTRTAAAALQGDTTVAAAGAAYLPPPAATAVQGAYDLLRRRSAAPADAEWVGSGNMVVRRSVFSELNGFDTTLEACEDVDFCRRVRASGRRLLEHPQLRNVHHGDPASLSAVFRGELWRGRDNARVSLRAPRSWRTLASLGTALVGLAGVALTVFGGLVLPVAGPIPLAAGICALGSLVAIRTQVMLRRRAERGTLVSTRTVIAVAAAYEAGRALALVFRISHGRRAAYRG